MEFTSLRFLTVLVGLTGLSIYFFYRASVRLEIKNIYTGAGNMNAVELHGAEETTTREFRPKILVWAKPFAAFEWTYPQLENGDGGCDLVYDRSQLENSDAVAFFMKTCKPDDLPDPKLRKKNQAFVWWTLESPWTVKNYYRHTLTEYNNYFNWTMTFHTKSDVVAAFWPVPAMDFFFLRLGRTSELVDRNLTEKVLPENEFQIEVKELMRHKSKFAAWAASDCNMTPMARRRKQIVLEIQKQDGCAVDKYGKCGDMSLPRENSAMFQTLLTYKFYMAFENSIHCRDYLTEKSVYNGLVAGTIPVVFGPTREDTAKILPKGSYLHVEDFKDLVELASYMKELDKNETAYMEYFKWWKDPGAVSFPRYGFNYGPRLVSTNSSYKQMGKLGLQDNWRDFIRFGLYHLCRKLKNRDHITTSKTVPDLAHEWYGTENEKCLKGR